MRIGEAWNTKWSDIDFTANTISITPEKNSEPRITRLSDSLMGMLRSLHNTTGSERLFGKWLKSQRRLYYNFRRRVAAKLNNPRILRITFHTFRHWKATTLYHQTKDIVYVMRFLGHKNIKNTLVYVQLEEAIYDKKNDGYVSKAATTVEEVCKLVESGFEYVCDVGEAKVFRKRK
jgi:integrase